jgi:hypothetical protein
MPAIRSHAAPILIGAGLGILATLPAALLALASAGGGHGHYELARALFPFSMLLTPLAGDTITAPLIVLALVQFPLYGAAIGFAAANGRAGLVALILLVLHGVAAALCFSGMIPNFS